MSTVIKVNDLGKKYILNHQKQERYIALRDVIAQSVKKWGARITNPLAGRDEIDLTREEFWALKDISFEIKQGERVGIIGRNGAGKSTLLKVLSRITEPTTGRIALRGRVASLLEVGTGFHPELTGRENIYLNGAILGMTRSEINKKFDEIVEFAEVEKFLDTPVKRYSSGMYVRLAFAVAAHLEPEILIVDEVLAVGDAQFQKKCLGKMKDVGKEGRTVLFVSHNLTAIRTLCTRAILLRQGMIIADETAAQAVSKYMGDIRVNMLFREWTDENTAPQNTSTVLKKVFICDDNGKQIEELYTDTAFNVAIEFKVKEEGASAGLTLLFYDDENNIVFSSINNHEVNWYGRPMPVGVYKSFCKIPSNLFNNGWFSLSINLFGKGFTDSQMTHDTLRFEILDGLHVRGDYYGEYAGVIRPLLEWNTTSLKTKELL
ncbi:MAG: polysaccharide ABC transporter ATP-binding protein [Clostridia bacterium]|nr:polysaccharide ABC transporter ATP-binding protein [Clostridia bacterium]